MEPSEVPNDVRPSGWFLVALGAVILLLTFVAPLLQDRSPSLSADFAGCVFGTAFLGIGLPFALLGDAAVPVFGLPRKPQTWPWGWGLALVLIGALAFTWLRWHVGT